jgi:hypothetical protein
MTSRIRWTCEQKVLLREATSLEKPMARTRKPSEQPMPPLAAILSGEEIRNEPENLLSASQTFSRLASEWKAATRLLGNVTRKAQHPAYQQIIAMGPPAVPLMLEDLRQHPSTDWFWALTTITGENPITEEMAGDTGAMTEAWIRWGEEKGHLPGSPPTTKPSSPISERAVTA